MISHRYRCIYTQVPKCASTSIKHYLSKYCRASHTVNPYWYGKELLSKRAERLTQVINLYPDYFTFSFVRNPFQRIVSLYLHTCRRHEILFRASHKQPVKYRNIQEFVELCSDLLQEKTMWGKEAQKFFVDNRDKEFGPQKIKLVYLDFERCHVKPQTEFLLDFNPQVLFGVPRINDKPLSFIGRVENFQQDFHDLLKMLDMPIFSFPCDNSSREGMEKSYSSYYDKTTRRLIESLYVRDLELLGYQFDEDNGAIVSYPLSRSHGLEKTTTEFVGFQRVRVYLLRSWLGISTLFMRFLWDNVYRLRARGTRLWNTVMSQKVPFGSFPKK